MAKPTPLEVRDYMSSPAFTVRVDEPVDHVRQRLVLQRVSSLAVVSTTGDPVGVVSLTDLLGAQPGWLAGDMMAEPMISVEPGYSVVEAAKCMLEHSIHRVYVVEEDQLVGVLSTRDVMAYVCAARVPTPVSELMTGDIVTADVGDTVATARARLLDAHVTGLVVVDDDWPVGVFAQRDALLSSSRPDGTLLDDVMDPAIICIDADLPLHWAASQAASMDVRRLIACRHRRMVGILSGLDFVRAVV